MSNHLRSSPPCTAAIEEAAALAVEDGMKASAVNPPSATNQGTASAFVSTSATPGSSTPMEETNIAGDADPPLSDIEDMEEAGSLLGLDASNGDFIFDLEDNDNLLASPEERQQQLYKDMSAWMILGEQEPAELSDWEVSDDADLSLIRLKRAHIASGRDISVAKKMGMDPVLSYQLTLVEILQNHNVPVSMWNSLWSWMLCAFDLTEALHPTTLNSIVRDLEKRYDLVRSCATVVEECLPQAKVKVQIVIHDFKEQFYSLLTDPDVMKEENLLIRLDNPFCPPETNLAETLRDINDGQVYKKAYQIYVKHPHRDVLCPIILFIDKTHVDAKGRLCLEPVSFTLGILKKEVRNLPYAWRPLGYVLNQANVTANLTPLQKAIDYHFVLGKILESLKQVQLKKGGIAWLLDSREDDQKTPVFFKVPVLFVVGDTEGHDKMCGHYLNRTKVKALCRYCKCPFHLTGSGSLVNPDHPNKKDFAFVAQSEIERLVKGEKWDELHELSYHPLVTAFSGIQFCDPKRGINGGTVGEVLHVLQHGLFLYYFTALFGQKKKSDKKKKPTAALCESNTTSDNEGSDMEEEEEDEPEEEEEDGASAASEDEECTIGSTLAATAFLSRLGDGLVLPGEEELSSHGIFTAKSKSMVDRQAKRYGRMLTHQSDRSFNRSFFSNGITAEAKKNAHEERCVLLLCLVLFCSRTGETFFDTTMDNARLSSHIILMEMLLLFENFLRLPDMDTKQVKLLDKFVPIMLSWFKEMVDRKTGVGMNFIKFHLPLHICQDILRFGPSYSSDSSCCEKNHKSTKAAARQTQKNSETFDVQTARSDDKLRVLDRGVRELRGGVPSIFNSPQGPDAPTPVKLEGPHYYVCADGCFDYQPTGKKDRKFSQWPKKDLLDHVTRFLQEKVLPAVCEDQLKLLTCAKVGGDIYRADPSYKRTHGHGRHDWVNFPWRDEENPSGQALTVPNRIITFLDLNRLCHPIPLDDQDEIDDPGYYALVQSAPYNLDKHADEVQAHQSSHLISKCDLCLDQPPRMKRPTLYLVKVSEFESPALAIPFDPSDESDLVSWLFIQPTQQWPEIFGNIMKEHIRKKSD